MTRYPCSKHVLFCMGVPGPLTVSFWFGGGLGSLLGGAGVLGLALGLAAGGLSAGCAPGERCSPGAALFFSLLPPAPAGMA